MDGIDSLVVLATDGSAQARWPPAEREYLGQIFEWRTYFQEARTRGQTRLRESFLSPAFSSYADGESKFALSAPILDEAGIFRGVLLATISIDKTLPLVPELVEGNQSGVLIGPRDRNSPSEPPPSGYWLVSHWAYAHGGIALLDRFEAKSVPFALEKRLDALLEPLLERQENQQILQQWGDPSVASRLIEANYRDPLENEPQQRWVAGFAPVGRTGFVAGIQTPYSIVLAPTTSLILHLVRLASALLILFIIWRGWTLFVQDRRAAL